MNSALVAIKLSTPVKAEHGRLAIKQTTRALGMEGDSIRVQGKKALSDGEKAKCLYRRAVGYLSLREEADKAIADLTAAKALAPDDSQIDQTLVAFPLLLLLSDLLDFAHGVTDSCLSLLIQITNSGSCCATGEEEVWKDVWMMMMMSIHDFDTSILSTMLRCSCILGNMQRQRCSLLGRAMIDR